METYYLHHLRSCAACATEAGHNTGGRPAGGRGLRRYDGGGAVGQTVLGKIAATAGRLLSIWIGLDVLMPGMDGVTALKNLKKKPVLKLIPVILLTARGHTLDPEEAKKAGASYYLTKPFSPTELLKQVQQLAASGSSQTVLN